MKINGHAIYKHYIRLRISCFITLSPNIMNTITITITNSIMLVIAVLYYFNSYTNS